jgi:hypothetical protein
MLLQFLALGNNSSGPQNPPNGHAYSVWDENSDWYPATYITVMNNGSITYSGNGSSSPTGYWFEPHGTGVGTSYYVRFTKVAGGDNPTSPYNPGSGWLALTSNRSWGYAGVNTLHKGAAVTVEIASDAAGNYIVSTSTQTVDNYA